MELTAGNYSDAEAFLNKFVNYEQLLGTAQVEYNTKNFDLDNFRELLRELGDPHLKYAVIHIAGTKGKGSTCAYLASAFQECGLKVGLYTSPHLEAYTERIQVNGSPISDANFCQMLSNLAERTHFAADAQGEQGPTDSGTFRTVFELLTAAAFLHFAEQEVDIAIIETGLGGRLDSTNVFDTPGSGPLVTVVGPIGYDHTSILGQTIEEIAAEKAGIVRSHGLVVLAPQPPEWAANVQGVLEKRLVELGTEQYLDVAALISGHECVEERPHRTSSPDATYAEYTLDPDAAPPESLLAQSMVHGLVAKSCMHGSHQMDNIRTALGAILALENAPGFGEWAATVPRRRRGNVEGIGRGASAECVRRGIGRTRLAGRFEIVTRHPVEIVDGAHCPLSAAAMAETYSAQYGGQEAILVLGFLRDKDPIAICEAIKDKIKVAAIMCCTPATPRALPAEEAALAVSQVFCSVPVETVPDLEEAIRAVADLREPIQSILVFGSMYLVAPAKRTLREQSTAISGC